MNAWNDLLDDTKRYLLQLKEMGVDTLPLENSLAMPKTRKARLDAHFKSIKDCTDCKLCEARTQVVYADGTPDAEILFIGEGPGRDEDEQGLPFVGRAGQLLTKMINAMGLERSEVYIANIVKCRPPENRNPEPDEVAACIEKLFFQIDTIQPKVLVLLGKVPFSALFDSKEGITKARGTWREFRGIPTMPTFHPAYLLRNPNAKHEAWDDLQAVLKKVGRKAPKR